MSELHATREGWLQAATDAMRPMFRDAGATIPDKIRFAMAFPSAGARGKTIGECWQDTASADGYYTIIIRADQADTVAILVILLHELVHACLPSGSGHGKTFRKLAVRLGLEGKMTATHAGDQLAAELEQLSNAPSLGLIPHSRLNFAEGADDKPKKQGTRMLKVACPCPDCGYMVRMTKKWAEIALPECPVDDDHGKMVCEAIEDDDAEEAA